MHASEGLRVRDLPSAVRRLAGSSLLASGLLTRYWWAVLIFAALCIGAGLWAARYTTITKLRLPFMTWERSATAARRPPRPSRSHPAKQVQKPSRPP
jgi:hypothetical protein